MDIELAVDMLELAPRIDHAVLFSGDSDFRRLVEAVQRKAVRVSVVSSIRTSPPMVADELRRQADQFLELAEIAPEFTRRQTEPRTRPAPIRQTPADPFQDSAELASIAPTPSDDCPALSPTGPYRAVNRPTIRTGSTPQFQASVQSTPHC